MTNRRNFIKATGLGLAAVSVPVLASSSASDSETSKSDFGFKLGVASYSFREFTQEQAIDMTLRCGVNQITFKSMHLPLDSDKETIKKTVALCKQKGVNLYGGGVIYMKSKAEVDQAFDYAKAAEMKMIVGVPNHDLLDYVEGKVKEYDIMLAIHNHGPGDLVYPSAESAYVLIKNRDPEQDLKDFFDRVIDVHIKDVTAANAEGTTCIIGRGVINFPSFMKSVVKLGYKGTLSLEYEAEGKDPQPGMMESFGFVKGVLAMM